MVALTSPADGFFSQPPLVFASGMLSSERLA